jgi:YD repeat-containing protein
MLQYSIKSASVWFLALAIAVSANQAQANPAESAEHEESIAVEQLPAKVRQALQLAIQAGEIEKIEKETENGKTVFEIEVEIEGGTVELTYDSEGQLVGIEVAEGDGEEAASKEAGEHEVENDDAAHGEKKADDEEDDDEDHEDHNRESKEVAVDTTLDQLSPEARKAIKRRAGQAELVGVEAITQCGSTVYEAAWMNGDVKHEITVTDAGDVISQEESIGIKRLPEVLHKLANKFAGDSKLKLERKMLVIYELEIEIDGQEKELCVDASGRQVNVELGDDDHDDEYDDEHESARGTHGKSQKKHVQDEDDEKVENE